MEEISRFLSISYGSGYGDGYGDGSSIKAINGYPVHMVDGIPTIILGIRHGFAVGHIVNSDLTLTSCVVAKGNDMFAHGATVREATEALRDKLFDGMPEDDRIAAFWACHNRTDAYTGHDLYAWHHRLTGSCEMGRQTFVRDRGLSLDATYTVDEFIALCERDFGGAVIRRLKEDPPCQTE